MVVGKQTDLLTPNGARDSKNVSGVRCEQIRLFKHKGWVERSPRRHFFINHEIHEIHESGKEAGE